jgi:hypothetical protein
MKLIAKTTIRAFYERMLVQYITSERGKSIKLDLEKLIDEVETDLRRYDGDIYEYSDMCGEIPRRGLCVVDSSGTIIKKL